MGAIVLLAEVLGDSAGLLEDEVAVFDGGGFAEGSGDFGAEFGRGEAVGGAVCGNEVVGQGEGGEKPCYADCAGGVEEVECYIW